MINNQFSRYCRAAALTALFAAAILAPNYSFGAAAITSTNYYVTAGNGNGICFWADCTNYKIHMGTAAEYWYGPVTEYAVKFNMGAGSAGRGWVWGTTGLAPVAALNVSGNMQIAGTMTAASFSGTFAGTYTGTMNAANISAGTFGANTGNGNYTFPAGLTATGMISANNVGGNIFLPTGGAINGGVWTGVDNIMRFANWTDATKGVVVNLSSGNVGIGTTSPGTKLQVNANSGVYPSAPTLGSGTVGQFSLLSGNGLYGLYSGISGNGDTWFQSQRNDVGTSTYNILLNPSGGNVGIGTTVPMGKLDVYAGDVWASGSGATFHAAYTAASSTYSGSFNWYGLQLGNNGANYIVGGRSTAGGSLYFVVNNTSDFPTVNGTTAMTITSAGNVNIPANVTAGSFIVSSNSQLMAGNVVQNLKLMSGGAGSVGISGYDSAGTWQFQLYGAGGTNYGFLNGNWAGWDIQKTVGGAMVLNGSQTVLTTANYNSYAPTLTGTGASGTWGISITGNAGTATTATNATNASNVTGGSLSGNLVASNYGIGNVGVYSAVNIEAIWSMGAAYVPPAGGANQTGVYGLVYSYEPNYITAGNNPGAIAGLGHQIRWVSNGTTQTAIGSGIYTNGPLYVSGVTSNYLYNDGTYIRANTYLRATNGIYSDGWLQSVGNLQQAAGAYVYPGYLTGQGTGWNGSYYLAGSTTWGIYSNTSFNAQGVYDVGARVYSPANVPGVATFSNNAGYITAGSTLTGLVQSTAAGTSYITGGNVGIGSASPNTTFYVNGKSHFIGGIYSEDTDSGVPAITGGNISAKYDICIVQLAKCLSTVSDSRLKKDISPLGSTLDRVMRLRPITYRWNQIYLDAHPLFKNSAPVKIGFIAQDVQPLFPEPVAKGAGGYYTLDYEQFVPVLTSAVQELKTEKDKQIGELQNKIDAQQKLIEELQKEIKSLRPKK